MENEYKNVLKQAQIYLEKYSNDYCTDPSCPLSRYAIEGNKQKRYCTQHKAANDLIEAIKKVLNYG